MHPHDWILPVRVSGAQTTSTLPGCQIQAVICRTLQTPKEPSHLIVDARCRFSLPQDPPAQGIGTVSWEMSIMQCGCGGTEGTEISPNGRRCIGPQEVDVTGK
jgi:hypothetical protein